MVFSSLYPYFLSDVNSRSNTCGLIIFLMSLSKILLNTDKRHIGLYYLTNVISLTGDFNSTLIYPYFHCCGKYLCCLQALKSSVSLVSRHAVDALLIISGPTKSPPGLFLFFISFIALFTSVFDHGCVRFQVSFIISIRRWRLFLIGEETI